MKNENDIIQYMDTYLSDKELAADLNNAINLIKQAQQLFSDYNKKEISLQLNQIIDDVDNILVSSKTIKEATIKLNKKFIKNSTKVEFDDEILKIDLSEKEMQYLEDLVISEELN